MPENLFPTTIAGFTEYTKIACAKAEANLSKYCISSSKLTPVTPLYNTCIQAEAVAANPETATTGARRTRDEAGDALKKEWRKFLNENIRIRQSGTRHYEIDVPDSVTGSNIYLAVTEVGEELKHESEYRKMDFSSNCHPIIEFPLEQLAKQANIYARYSNTHGKEDPESIAEAIVIA